MSTQLMPFFFESKQIRAVVLDGTPLFSARDVALALAYADPSQAYNAHCKSLKLLSSVESTELGWTNPNPRGEYVIPKSDILRLIVKSEKPEAERFERWVFEEVLPSIMDTGSYSVKKRPASVIDTLREWKAIAEYYGLSGNQAILSAEQAVIPRLGFSPMREIGITHLAANDRGMTYSPTELGKLMTPSLSAVKVNRLLELHELQTKELGHWIPTDRATGLAEWLDTGKRHRSGAPVKQLKWFREALDRLPAPALLQAA